MDSSSRKQHNEGRLRVVIADDDRAILDQICSLLEPHFEVVGRATNGADLFKTVQEVLPTVVVTDLAMPEVNGIEAARLITTHCPDVKVVMLSVYDDPVIIDAVFEAGASGYVSKFDADSELIAAIENVLDGRLYRSSHLR